MRKLALALLVAMPLALGGCAIGGGALAVLGESLTAAGAGATTISAAPSAVGVIKNLIHRRCTFSTFETCGKASALYMTPLT